MKLARSHNAVRNMRAGVISKIVNILFPFLVRAVFIRTLGAEYLGVNSLFTSVLSVLSLTELGFGSAVVFSMYRAIAEDNHQMINELLLFYRNVYRWVGCIILGIGLLLIPFLPYLTKGSYPADINPLIVYLVFLINTVLSYFMFAYLNSLMQAFQRTDVSTIIAMFMNIAKDCLQIILLLTVKNYYAYLTVMPVFTVLSNLRTAIIARKMFPHYHPYGKLSTAIKAEIKEKVSGLLIQKLCSVSRNAFDSIFISIFLGLTEIAIYNNYYYIMKAITGFMGIATSAVLAGVGNSVATETKEKNHQDMMRMNFVYMWISGWFTACLLCLYQPFMRVWAGSKMLLPMSSVVLLCAYFYTLKMGDVRSVYSSASGLWWQNRYRALAEAVANIVLNYVLGKYYGINGIIAATLISLFIINFCYGSQLVYKYYFTGQKARVYYLFHAVFAMATVIICTVCWLICKHIPDTLPGFTGKVFVCILIPNSILYLLFSRTELYHDAVPWFLKRIGIRKNLFKHS